MSLGNHACWAFSTDREHRRVLTSYLSQGLRTEQRVAFFGSPHGREEIVASYLASAGYDVEQLVADGRLILGTADDIYLIDGEFSPDARIADYRAMVHAATGDGFKGLRVAGETTWLLQHNAARALWPGYELRADVLASQIPFLALCCYDQREWSEVEIARICSVHSHTLNATPRAAFHLHVAPNGGLTLAGELDFIHADTVEHALRAGAADARPVLDLSGLRFTDASGARAIAEGVRAFTQRHRKVAITGASPAFGKLWSLLGYGDSIPDAALVAG
jgi:anti-anti-sigma factor